MSARGAERFTDTLERRLEPLDRAILLAEWRLATGRSRTGAGPWQERRHRVLSAPEVLESVRRFREEGHGGRLERRLALLERATLESRIEQDPAIVRIRSRLQSRVAAFRPLWHGRRVNRVVLWRVLRNSANREERRAAYYAQDPVYRAVERELRALVGLRNAKAREFGFRSYPEYRLSFDRLSVARLEELLESALRYVPAEMRRIRSGFEDATGERDFYPWDVNYARERAGGLPEASFPPETMLPSILRGVRAWGIPSSALRFRVTRHDIPSGGLCLAPSPPRDVRVVIHPGRGGWEDYMVLFHEVGHAVHSASIRAPTHLLRWHEGLPGFGGFHEGIGEVFAEIAQTGSWLHTRPGLPTDAVHRFVAEHRRSRLRDVGWLGEWIRRELGLYLRPGQDPGRRTDQYQRGVLGMDASPPTSFADSFYIEAPVYGTSYLIANLLCPQLLAAALGEAGGPLWPNRKVGPWFVRHWFREGSAFDWLPRVREVTGQPFGAGAFNDAMRSPRAPVSA